MLGGLAGRGERLTRPCRRPSFVAGLDLKRIRDFPWSLAGEV